MVLSSCRNYLDKQEVRFREKGGSLCWFDHTERFYHTENTLDIATLRLS